MSRGGYGPALTKSEGKPPQKVWECELCMFHNSPGSQVCEGCLTGTFSVHAVGNGKRKASVDISMFFSPQKKGRGDRIKTDE